MNILPYHIHSILKIYRNSAGSVTAEKESPSPATEALPSDRVDISEEGRKEQIKREIVADIIRKIR